MSAPTSQQHGANYSEGAFSGTAGHSNHPHLYAIKIKLIHSKAAWGKLANIFNPNHRHDELHEQRTDNWRREIAESHRYESFAQETVGNDVKWYVDGRDYFWAVSTALDNAKECIYIEDWWLSPELFLRRPAHDHPEWRLDDILRRKARLGVQIYIIIYKEVAPAISSNSAHSKFVLSNLFPRGDDAQKNICVMRHPDHLPFTHGADSTWKWAHHEKFIVVDHKVAFIGGMDLCFGRWDLQQHPLADVHPNNVAAEVWPGQDFNNNRVMDFANLDKWEENGLDKKIYGRMPWHDVSIGIVGPAVLSIADHFVGRWNFIKRDKYKRHANHPWIILRGIPEQLSGVQRPAFPMGGYRKHPIHPENEDLDGKQGPCDVQLVRSSADWSHGLLPKEHSIQNAYIAIIEQAQHFIYIENQFFITATGDQQKPIENQIGAAIVAAVVRAHEENRKFRVMIVIPAIPGFVGDLRTKEALGTRAIIDNQYKSINRGEHSIYGQLKGKGIDPEKYIFVFNLRIYDRIHTTQQLLDREKDTGIEYREVQAANAMKALGPGIVQPGPSSGKSPMSPSEQEKLQSRKEIFEEGMGEVQAKDTVAADAMKSGVRLTDEVWDGGEELEKKDFFQEELYIHAKVMIVDDETLIVGSSNINDRSQLGDHDSELSAVVKHKPTVSSLRKQLWMEHLGLLPPQSVTPDREEINAQPPGVSGNFSEPDPIVEDALGEEVWNLWTSQATRNTKIYREMFHADPDDSIITWKNYDEFRPHGTLAGHIWNPDNITTREVKERLSEVRGHLVWMPMKFLEGEVLVNETDLSVNYMTMNIYT